MNTANRTWVSIARWTGYLVIAAILAWVLVVAFRQSRSYQWSSVEGTVIESWYKPPTRSRLLGTRQLGKSHGHSYLSYEYEVNGTRYEGSRYSAGRAIYDIKSLLSRYKPGDSITVYYDPKNPSSAVLKVGLDWATLGAAAFVALVIAPILWMLRDRPAVDVDEDQG